MIKKNQEKMRGQVSIVDLEMLVPSDHLLRKIDRAIDFSKIYEMVEELYCADNGRMSVDPVVLFKMVLIQHLYGLPSLRRTASEIEVNVVYRWFLGYGLTEEPPHFSTVSYNFRHRFTAETVDKIFNWVLDEISEAGYLSPSAVFIDGTHIKASANNKEKHAMRYTHYRGLAQVQNWVKLKFAAINIKKFAKRKWNDLHRSSHSSFVYTVFAFLFNNFKTPALDFH